MSSLFVSKKEVPLSSGAVVKCPLADFDEGAPHAPRSGLLALFACFIHAPQLDELRQEVTTTAAP